MSHTSKKSDFQFVVKLIKENIFDCENRLNIELKKDSFNNYHIEVRSKTINDSAFNQTEIFNLINGLKNFSNFIAIIDNKIVIEIF